MEYIKAMKLKGSEKAVKGFEESKMGRVTDVSITDDSVVITLSTIDGDVTLSTKENMDKWNDHKGQLKDLEGTILKPYTKKVPFTTKSKATGRVSSGCNGRLPTL